jgi:hypothetical protein
MRKYFVHNGQQQAGPYTIEELRDKDLQPNIFIWFEGMDTWMQAGKIDELKHFFVSAPPAFTLTTPAYPAPPQKKNISRPDAIPKEKKKKSPWFFIVPLIIVVAAIAFGLINYIKQKSEADSTFSDPQRDLNVVGNYSIGPFGQKTTLQGKIVNNSASRSYGQETIRISFFDKDGNYIADTYETVYNYISPGGSATFNFKVSNAQGTKSVGIGIYSGQ